MSAAPESDLQRLDRLAPELDRRLVVDRWGRVGFRNPTRAGALAGLALTVVLLTLMLTIGDVPVGRYPFAERLLAWTLTTLLVTLPAGVAVRVAGRRWPGLHRVGFVLLSTALATFLAFGLILACAGFLPLHLEVLTGEP